MADIEKETLADEHGILTKTEEDVKSARQMYAQMQAETKIENNERYDTLIKSTAMNNPPAINVKTTKLDDGTIAYIPENQSTKKITKPLDAFRDKVLQAEKFYELQPIYYDEADLWWLWNFNKKCWKKIDDIDMCLLLDGHSIDTTNGKNRSEILHALKLTGRRHKPKPFKDTWIQFGNKIVDIETNETFDSTPEYFAVNPIPWTLDPLGCEKTDEMDKLFTEWVDIANVKKLYQIIAYTLLPSYPIKRLFCLVGNGNNGKSKFVNLIEKFIGEMNTCTADLDRLADSSFETSSLYKKLMAIVSETNFSVLRKTSTLKSLTGDDQIKIEFKGKNAFKTKNYAKIFILSNELPATSDYSDGFFSRWLIIDFPHSFSEKQDVLKRIPDYEYNSLASKCVTYLRELLSERAFDNEGDIKDRRKRYEEKSDPLKKFMDENSRETKDNELDIPVWRVHETYDAWAKERRTRQFTIKALSQNLRRLGYQVERVFVGPEKSHDLLPHRHYAVMGITLN
jgi:P4 family phage/plasmid primase-like protien